MIWSAVTDFEGLSGRPPVFRSVAKYWFSLWVTHCEWLLFSHTRQIVSVMFWLVEDVRSVDCWPPEHSLAEELQLLGCSCTPSPPPPPLPAFSCWFTSTETVWFIWDGERGWGVGNESPCPPPFHTALSCQILMDWNWGLTSTETSYGLLGTASDPLFFNVALRPQWR